MAVVVAGFGKRMAASFHRGSGREVGLLCDGWQGFPVAKTGATDGPARRHGAEPKCQPMKRSYSLWGPIQILATAPSDSMPKAR